MKKFFGKKRTLALAVVAVLAVAGAAFAYWTQSGSGSGSATVGSTNGITVNQTSSVTGLYPGGPGVALSGNFDNANDSAVKVGSVTASVVDTTDPGCTAADFAVEGAANVNAEVPAGAGVGSWSGLTIRMLDSASNQDACKGATVHLSYSSN